MTCGIYKLNFSGTHQVYIGQSKNIEERWTQHKTSLKTNKQPKKLQQAFNIYGMPELEILLECAEDELDQCEDEAIKIFNSVNDGFNTLSEHGHRTLLVGTKAGNQKYSKDLVIEVFTYLTSTDLTHADIQDITGMSRGAIQDIQAGNTHTWLQQEFPEEYKKLLQLKYTRRTNSISRALGGSKVKPVYPNILSPTGEVHEVIKLREFCRQHNLNHGQLGEVLRGHKTHHKGWTLA